MPGLPFDFWEQEKRRLLAVLGPHLAEATRSGVAAAETQVKRFGIGFNGELANQAAADWSKRYTDDLLNLLNTTSEKIVGDALAQWITQPGTTIGKLVDLLDPEFGEGRANTIAVTEITRAYAQGNKTAYQEAGVTHWTWRTNRDELVCKYCGPLNNKTVRIGDVFGALRGRPVTEPPFHPNCRCWIVPNKVDHASIAARLERNQKLPAGDAKLRPG